MGRHLRKNNKNLSGSTRLKMSESILITGATGFLGKHIVPELVKEGYHCKLLVRNLKKSQDTFSAINNVEYIVGDITDSNRLADIFNQENFKTDYIIHLAALLGNWNISEKQIMDINYLGTKNLLKNMPQIKHFIFCSTPGVLGFDHKNADENLPYNPRSSYERSKVAAEKAVQEICTSRNIAWTIIRPDFVYGPEDIRRVPLYKKIRDRRMPLLGNGQALLSPTYIKDVADAFLKCIANSKAKNNIFNISGTPITVQELFNLIASLQNTTLPRLKAPLFLCNAIAFVCELLFKSILKEAPPITRSRIEFLTKHHSVSHDKAQKLLGYKPCFTAEEGIKRTLDWCKRESLL